MYLVYRVKIALSFKKGKELRWWEHVIKWLKSPKQYNAMQWRTVLKGWKAMTVEIIVFTLKKNSSTRNLCLNICVSPNGALPDDVSLPQNLKQVQPFSRQPNIGNSESVVSVRGHHLHQVQCQRTTAIKNILYVQLRVYGQCVTALGNMSLCDLCLWCIVVKPHSEECCSMMTLSVICTYIWLQLLDIPVLNSCFSSQGT